MKPRLTVQELTVEDEWIWLQVTLTFPSQHENLADILLRAVDQDRRDADLMWGAHYTRTGHWGWLVGWNEREDDSYEYVWCGGVLPAAREIHPERRYILYFPLPETADSHAAAQALSGEES